MAGKDGDFHIRDLHGAIARGEFPSWTLKMQIMPFDDAKAYRFNPFDLTKSGGPTPDTARFGEPAGWHTDGDMVHAAYTLHSQDDD
jgi:hypothetical protein